MSYSPEENAAAIAQGFTGEEDRRNNMRSQQSGGGDMGSAVASSVKMKQSDIDALRALDPSLIDPKSFDAAALAELTPYYERLLAESNWDVEEAKKRIEQDYKTGVRRSAEDLHTSLKKLIESDIPAEQKQQLESLNQRGMLGTILNQAAQGRSQNVTASYDTGTATSPYSPGKPITTTYTAGPPVTENLGTISRGPVTTAQFGGLAGKQYGEAETQRDARQEAITRAFQRYNETATTNRVRDITDATTKGVRGQRDLEQEKAEKVPILSGEKYSREVAKNTLKRNAILEPYQLEATGITGLLKY